MQFLLSALTGEKVTQAQLLGEEASDRAGKAAAAERDLLELEERRKKAGLGAGGMIPVESTGKVFMG